MDMLRTSHICIISNKYLRTVPICRHSGTQHDTADISAYLPFKQVLDFGSGLWQRPASLQARRPTRKRSHRATQQDTVLTSSRSRAALAHTSEASTAACISASQAASQEAPAWASPGPTSATGTVKLASRVPSSSVPCCAAHCRNTPPIHSREPTKDCANTGTTWRTP